MRVIVIIHRPAFLLGWPKTLKVVIRISLARTGTATRATTSSSGCASPGRKGSSTGSRVATIATTRTPTSTPTPRKSATGSRTTTVTRPWTRATWMATGTPTETATTTTKATATSTVGRTATRGASSTTSRTTPMETATAPEVWTTTAMATASTSGTSSSPTTYTPRPSTWTATCRRGGVPFDGTEGCETQLYKMGRGTPAMLEAQDFSHHPFHSPPRGGGENPKQKHPNRGMFLIQFYSRAPISSESFFKNFFA